MEISFFSSDYGQNIKIKSLKHLIFSGLLHGINSYEDKDQDEFKSLCKQFSQGTCIHKKQMLLSARICPKLVTDLKVKSLVYDCSWRLSCSPFGYTLNQLDTENIFGKRGTVQSVTQNVFSISIFVLFHICLNWNHLYNLETSLF